MLEVASVGLVACTRLPRISCELPDYIQTLPRKYRLAVKFHDCRQFEYMLYT